MQSKDNREIKRTHVHIVRSIIKHHLIATDSHECIKSSIANKYFNKIILVLDNTN